ncbi:MAG TPA: TonB-dependent receptor plug domain-containing protein [Longimicrobiaceae bacterium]|nr:TonB-dependent receptor plug domain-containing protein [Longimicrobiaceae bacterium]
MSRVRIGPARTLLPCCAAVLAALAAPAAAQARADLDLVPVGYGVQPVRQLTGSVASLVVRDAPGPRVAHVEQMLMGRFAGVEVRPRPDGSFSVRVRGTGTLLGSTEPLYVVDGVPLPVGSTLRGISPHDVARIDVLKDAGSTAIYGVRGANGVVLVTTRGYEP